MRLLSLFDYSGKIKQGFQAHNWECLSLDIAQNPLNNSVDIITNFLDWNYKTFTPGYFDFCFIAFPCQTFSKASGGFHFSAHKPKTVKAVQSINLILKLKIVIDYFGCKWILENPTSAIGNNYYFKNLFNYSYTRITQSNFGFPTRKQTDFYYNFNMLIVSPVTYRVNRKYQINKLDNLSYRSRVTYPDHLVIFLVENILKNI